MKRYQVVIYLTPGVDGKSDLRNDFGTRLEANDFAESIVRAEAFDVDGWFYPIHRVNCVRVREIDVPEATDGDEPGADDRAGGDGAGGERGADPGTDGGATARAAERGRPRGPKGSK